MTLVAAFFAGGVLLGGLIGYLLAQGPRASAESRCAELADQRQGLSAKLEAAQNDLARKGEQLARVETEKNLLANTRDAFERTFRTLAAEALHDSNARFTKEAQELVEPLQQTLARLQSEIQAMEGRRGQAYENLERELQQLQRETGNLVTALRRPEVRGRWGEIQLRRVVEVAGMSAYCDFSEQADRPGEEGHLRPDMVVHLAGGRDIVVDSKVPLDAYLAAVEAASEQDRAEALARHAAQVREHVRELSGKKYWSQFPTSPEFVVLFLPGESFFSAALERDRTLIEDAMEKRVILASPTTLIALLKAVAYGWRQEQIAKSAGHISDLGRELYDRVAKMSGYLQDLGGALSKAVDSYNRTVGSYENRVVVTTRKFKELGATASEEIPPLEPVDRIPRTFEVGQPSLNLNGKTES